MFDFAELAQYLEMIVVLGCLCLGYIIKTTFTKVPNNYIPAILGVVGIIINVLVNGLSVETVILGCFMGLAATGLHQTFVQFIEKIGKTGE